jgi:hypothetical protein
LCLWSKGKKWSRALTAFDRVAREVQQSHVEFVHRLNISSAKLNKSDEGKEMEGKQCEKLHIWWGEKIYRLWCLPYTENALFLVEVCWREGKALGSEGGKAITVDARLNNI